QPPSDRRNNDAYIRAVFGSALLYRHRYDRLNGDCIMVELQHATSTLQKIERGMSADEQIAILGQYEQQRVSNAEFWRDPRDFGQWFRDCCRGFCEKCRDALR